MREFNQGRPRVFFFWDPNWPSLSVFVRGFLKGFLKAGQNTVSTIPKEANVGKTTMPKEKGPTAKTDSSSTTEKSKERSCKLNKEEEEKKALQELAQGLERMFVKHNECVTMPKEEHNLRALKRRRTLGSDEA